MFPFDLHLHLRLLSLSRVALIERRSPQRPIDDGKLFQYLSSRQSQIQLECISQVHHSQDGSTGILFSLLNFVESIVLLKTLTANSQASFSEHSSL
jgi:hypothetical protein